MVVGIAAKEDDAVASDYASNGKRANRSSNQEHNNGEKDTEQDETGGARSVLGSGPGEMGRLDELCVYCTTPPLHKFFRTLQPYEVYLVSRRMFQNTLDIVGLLPARVTDSPRAYLTGA